MTLLLVRHADAGDRAAWTGDDTERPLSATGRDQAEALARLHRDIDLERLISSPARRCVDTLEPLAAVHGLTVETDDALAEGTAPDVVDRLLRRLSAQDVLLCSHGDVISATIKELRRRGDLGVRPEWPKGSTWVFDDWPAPTRIDYLPPPEAG